MMAFTTLLISVPIVILLYFLVIKRIKFIILNYIVVLVVGILFFFGMNLHLIYIGLEILLLGLMTVYIKDLFSKKKKAKAL